MRYYRQLRGFTTKNIKMSVLIRKRMGTLIFISVHSTITLPVSTIMIETQSR